MGLLGAYISEPISGVLVTTAGRPLSIQRFTAAHELGHFRLEHLPSLDDESILRRMAMPTMAAGPNMQEVEADSFAVAFLNAPRWLIAGIASGRAGWRGIWPDLKSRISSPCVSAPATRQRSWTLQQIGQSDLSRPRGSGVYAMFNRVKIKVDLLPRISRPRDYRQVTCGF